MNAIAAIALGGALGAVARHGVNVAAVGAWGTNFPYGTLIANVVGSAFMGLLIGVFAEYWQPSETLRLFLVTGALGAFTTFSTFSLDFITLYERHEYLQSALYLSASVILSIAALFAALAIVRAVAA